MGPRSRRVLAFCVAVCVLLFLGLLAGCGSSSVTPSPTATSTNSPAPGGTGGTGGSGGGTGSGGGGSTAPTVVSFVFTAGANNMTAYAVNSDGSLVAAPGSPYANPTDSQIVTNGANVYTVDSNQATLKIYSINSSNGTLTPGSTTNAITGNTDNPADLVDYLSMDHTGTSLYIGQFDSSGDDGVAFWSVGSAPTATFRQWDGLGEYFGPPLVWSPDNVYGYSGNCYHASWTVFSYTRASDGTLSKISFRQPAPPTPGSDMPCPIAFAVSAKGYLAIGASANPQGGTFSVGIYAIHSDGSLSLVSAAATASNGGSTGGAPMGINFDPSGSFLAVAGNGGVQTFALSSSGTLSAVGSPQSAGTQFENVAWDKSNHVFATTATQLYVWNANNGQLSAAPGSPVTGGRGVAVLPK